MATPRRPADHARVAVLGGGVAGSLVVSALARVAVPSLLVDNGSHPIDDRRWGTWLPIGTTEPAVARSWHRLEVRSGTGHLALGLREHRYAEISGEALREATDEAMDRSGGRRLTARVLGVVDHGDSVVVTTSTGDVVSDLVLDSTGVLPGELQQPRAWMSFEGWEVECDLPAFDPGSMVLMDFRVPQCGGLAFVYTVPTTPARALVELTTISASCPASPSGPSSLAMSGTLTAHLDAVVGRGRYRVVREERGTIPLRPRAIRAASGSTLAIGAAAGLVKASTGYGWPLMRRDADAVAAQVAQSLPIIGVRRRRRHAALDEVFLRLAADDPESLATALPLLFARNPADLVLRFLAEETSPLEELRLVSSLPVGPFAAAATRVLAQHLR